jgi:hypothetical protein
MTPTAKHDIAKLLYEAGIPRAFHDLKIDDAEAKHKPWLTNYKLRTKATQEERLGELIIATEANAYLMAKIALVTNRNAHCMMLCDWTDSMAYKQFNGVDLLVLVGVEPFPLLPAKVCTLFNFSSHVRWLMRDGIDVVLASDSDVSSVDYFSPAFIKLIQKSKSVLV